MRRLQQFSLLYAIFLSSSLKNTIIDFLKVVERLRTVHRILIDFATTLGQQFL